MDTEGTFRPDRIPPIAERFGLDAEAVLSNIVCARAFTHEQQSGKPLRRPHSMCSTMEFPGMSLDVWHLSCSMCCCRPSCGSCGPDGRGMVLLPRDESGCLARCLQANKRVVSQEPFRMLIMDSATSNFRVDFSGRGELAER